MADDKSIRDFCDERMREAIAKLSQIAAEDYAEDAAKATGFHPDYYMPVGYTFTRPYPTYPGKLNG